MEYQIQKEDLEKCFKFAVGYHLDKTKLSLNRTTGQYRGLGGIFDNFVIGKLIEIGVAKIIEKDTKKKCILDFGIHKLTKENISDPDIIKISEDGKERDPNIFAEIKNTSPDDRWVGLTAEQFSTILKGKLAKNDPKKVMIICASLFTKNEKGDLDPLGVYLKSKINSELLKKFCNIGELYVKIHNIVTGEELKNKGTAFNKDSYMYETDIINEAGESTAKKVLKLENREVYKKINLEKTKFPIIMCDLKPKPKEFGEFEYDGDIEIYLKENRKKGELKSKRVYIYSKKDTIIKNNVLGNFELKKGKIYECWFTTIGLNPKLKRNNIWIAGRNLINMVSKSPEERIKEIKEKI